MSSRRLTALALALVLAVTLVPAAAMGAPAGPIPLLDAVKLLRAYGVVEGDPSGDLRLYEPITRGQAAKVLAVAFGRSDAGTLLAGAPVFSDTGTHWSSGYVAAIKDLGLIKGHTDGSFRPDDPVTHAEMATILLRAVGKEWTIIGPWPAGPVDAARRAGLIVGDTDWLAKANAPAMRADVFQALAQTLSRVPVGPTGATLLQLYLARGGPTLTVDPAPATTRDAKVTVRGTVSAGAEVTVAGETVAVDASGRFAATVPLKVGANNIRIQAADLAGNTVERQVAITYEGVARLVITPDRATTTLGTPVTLRAKAYDNSGKELTGLDITWTVDPDRASFDASTGRLTPRVTGDIIVRARAAAKEATATVTVSSTPARLLLTADRTTMAANGRSVAKLTVKVLDSAGNLVPDARIPVLLSTSSNLIFLESTLVTTSGGTATVGVMSARAGATGAATVVATVAPTAQALGPSSVNLNLEARRLAAVRLEARPNALPAVLGRQGAVVATAVDQDGEPMPAPETIQVSLTSSAPASAVVGATAQISSGLTDSIASGANGNVQALPLAGAVIIGGDARLTFSNTTVPVHPGALTVGNVGTISALRISGTAGAPADGTTPMTLLVSRLDGLGQVQGMDSAPVTLVPDKATVSMRLVNDFGGVAIFEARSFIAGPVTFTASAPGLAGVPAVTATGAFFSTTPAVAGPRVRLDVVNAALPADGVSSTQVRATLLNELGAEVANTGTDIELLLSVSTASGYLTDSTIIIPTGSSSSIANVAEFRTTAAPGTVTINGTIVRGSSTLTVLPAYVGVYSLTGGGYFPPTTGGGGTGGGTPLVGNQLMMFPPAGQPAAGSTTLFDLRITDNTGSTITTGAYAFRIQVSINGQVQAGVPEGMTVALDCAVACPALNPVTQTVRTAAGLSRIRVTYNKAGTVTLTPVAQFYTISAPDINGIYGEAAATTGFGINAAASTYVSGAATKVTLSVIPNLGDNKSGAISTGSAVSAWITAQLTDTYGNALTTGSQSVTLTRTGSGASQLPGGGSTYNFSLTNGQATVKVSNDNSAAAGTVTYTSTATGLTGDSITVTTYAAAPAKPVISYVQGNVSQTNGTVTGQDANMVVQLAAQSGGPVSVTVFDNFTSIHTAGPVDIGSGDAAQRRVPVPVSKLNYAGSHSIRVRVGNGAGDSDYSEAVAVTYSPTGPSASISSARFNAAAGALEILGSFPTSGVTVRPQHLTVRDTSTGQTLSLASTDTVSITGSKITVTLTGSEAAAVGDPNRFAGTDVRLEGATGWMVNSVNNSAATFSAVLTPAARLASVSYNGTSTVKLMGEGFTTGSYVNPSKLTFNKTGSSYTLTTSNTGISSDGMVTINLNSADTTAMSAGGWTSMTALVGWLVDNAGYQAPAQAGIGMGALLNAYYDATTDKMMLEATSGVLNAGSGLDATKLTVQGTGGSVTLTGYSGGLTFSSTTVSFNLVGADATALEAATFTGAQVKADAGWNGSAPSSTGVTLRPWARAASASYNTGAKVLTLSGSGFGTGTLVPANLTFTGTGSYTLTGGTVAVDSDSQVRVTLNSTDATAVGGLGGSLTLAGGSGWFAYSGYRNPTFTGLAVTVVSAPPISLSSAKYNAGLDRLTLNGTNLPTDVAKYAMGNLKVRDTGTGAQLTLSSGTTLAGGSSATAAILQLTTADAAALEATASFSGTDVELQASEGWALDSSGNPAGSATVSVTPAAHITAASYSASTKQLVLTGSGFTTGTLKQTLISIHDPSTSQTLSLNGADVVPSADGSVTITLIDADAGQLGNSTLFNGTDVKLNAAVGWLTDGSNGVAPVSNVPVTLNP